MTPERRHARTEVERLHAEVDGRAAALAREHGERLHCARGCCGCCVDDLRVFEVEADVIRERHGRLLAAARPHPRGACAFLDEAGACRIYDARPYVCRTQGLPLRWFDEVERVERRDICPLNEAGEPVESLPAEACWTLGDFEGRLAALQAARGDGALRRVTLRSLFDASR